MSRAYTQGTSLPVSSRTHSQADRHAYEDDVKEQPVKETEQSQKSRRPRGTSSHVQVKIRRDIHEAMKAVANANSISTSEVIEKILEMHVGPVNEALETLKMCKIF